MHRKILFWILGTFWVSGSAWSGEQGTKILLIGKDRDHKFGTHEYMTDCNLLAHCLRQTPGVEAIVSNGWPKNEKILEGVDAIALYTNNGGNVLLGSPVRSRVERLFEKGVGLTAIHWSTGAHGKEVGELWLANLGGWFNRQFSEIPIRRTTLRQVDPRHPICFGWKEYPLRDEYYIKLRFHPESRPVLSAEIDGESYTVGWTYIRPDSGRSFGFVCGHFHDNFAEESFRRAIINGILWTADHDVPEAGAPVAVTAKELELPPDTRPKKKKK